jgi:hypothetical protein
MATVTIGGNDYPVYADVPFADAYLAADAVRWESWDDADPEAQKRGLVSATRLLQRTPGWTAGAPPSTDDAPLAVQQACAMLAADILAKPSLSGNASTASNIKSVYADGTGVDFFASDSSLVTPLPSDAWALLVAAGLMGGGNTGAAGPVYSGGCQESYFPEREGRWNRPGSCIP